MSADHTTEAAHRAPLLGAAVEWRLVRASPRYRRLFLAHYSALTAENVMKMDALAPAPDVVDLTEADELVAWARRHDVSVHGHTLVWHRQLPAWLEQRDWPPDELRAFLQAYVTRVVGHFRGRVRSWDVVNEPLARDGKLRPSIWQRTLGDDYIADALRWAHAADPSAKLFVNEFNVERPGRKAEGMFRLLARLKREDVPLDGIGLQAHLTQHWRPTATELRRIMRRYAALGLEVDISELDVAVGRGRTALRRQAEIYRTVARACRQQPACRRFTTWGFTDSSTWLGTSKRPLPFATDGSPKPAWRAIVAGMRD